MKFTVGSFSAIVLDTLTMAVNSADAVWTCYNNCMKEHLGYDYCNRTCRDQVCYRDCTKSGGSHSDCATQCRY
ncbi:hypothetical protein BG006_005335 [Podila minutissima]|uniref:Uncharacterized protein n=1 Tax=Podila minutissima TaxID=64525 RepID=A0A9P5STA1_9FUNG|nr:hypothetical protein BG006_005335 [Podila minutissima]